MGSYRMFEQAIYGAAPRRNEIAACGRDLDDVERDSEGEQANPRLIGASTAVLGTMAARLEEYSCQFERLEEVVDR